MSRHVYPVRLRWSDMDAYGHVNNVVYLTYLEEARVGMLTVDPPGDRATLLERGVVVARHEIDYRRPLVFRPEPVRVETWVTHVRSASFALAYEIRDDEVVYARAGSVLVPYDLAEGRPRRLTTGELAFLAAYRDDDPPGDVATA